jgi:hypothetical protein
MLGMLRFASAAGASLLALAGTPAAPSADTRQPDAAQRCAMLGQVALPGVEITRAAIVAAAPAGTLRDPQSGPIAAAFPEYCRIEGMIDRRRGADDVEYGIGFALALPANWNGRLLYNGGGGFNGSIPEPWGIFATAGNPALARGFAVVTMDSGHKGQGFDVGFLADQQASLDFALSAVPTATRVAKALVAHYFGRAPHHSYSLGCSTGGREGMMAAQRYPSLFDGVIAGAPAMRTGATRLGGWNARIAFNRAAPRDADGRPLAAEAFPAPDQKLLAAALAGQCDALDGLADGLIMNRAACRFDPAVLRCRGDKRVDCLSAAQVTALATAFGGPRDAGGNLLYVGYPYDLGLLGDAVGNLFGVVPGTTPGPFDTPPSPLEFDFAAEIERLRTDGVQQLTDTYAWTNLGTFYRRGGKILFVHGASDPWYSVLDTEDYVRRLEAANPGFDSSRFYSVPSMGHCIGGGPDNFDMLGPMVEWVERGAAPGPVKATGSGARGLWRGGERLLCPWPQHAHYTGGDPNRAESFECRAS